MWVYCLVPLILRDKMITGCQRLGRKEGSKLCAREPCCRDTNPSGFGTVTSLAVEQPDLHLSSRMPGEKILGIQIQITSATPSKKPKSFSKLLPCRLMNDPAFYSAGNYCCSLVRLLLPCDWFSWGAFPSNAQCQRIIMQLYPDTATGHLIHLLTSMKLWITLPGKSQWGWGVPRAGGHLIVHDWRACVIWTPSTSLPCPSTFQSLPRLSKWQRRSFSDSCLLKDLMDKLNHWTKKSKNSPGRKGPWKIICSNLLWERDTRWDYLAPCPITSYKPLVMGTPPHPWGGCSSEWLISL